MTYQQAVEAIEAWRLAQQLARSIDDDESLFDPADAARLAALLRFDLFQEVDQALRVFARLARDAGALALAVDLIRKAARKDEVADVAALGDELIALAETFPPERLNRLGYLKDVYNQQREV